MVTTQQDSRLAARLKLVEEHVQAENRHDAGATMNTFGEQASFSLNAEHFGDRNAVTAWYDELLGAFPDFRAEVRRRHVTDEAIVLEGVLYGTHRADFRGIPATGRSIEIPVCAVFDFDENERLRSETVYLDAALMLTQLGVMPQPETAEQP
jgi:steroid delta-isomerase-like uncharacterized protein